MHELLILAIVVTVCMAVATIAFRFIAPALRVIEYVLATLAIAVVMFVLFFIGAEVVMRYVFNSPIPGHLEGSELLMPIIVFMGLSYTQATHGHVGMDLVLDAVPESVRRYAVSLTLLAAMFICAVLAYFASKNAFQLYTYDDVTMTPPYFRTWPAAAAIPLGYGLTALRMYLQVLNLLAPERFPEHAHRVETFETVE